MSHIKRLAKSSFIRNVLIVATGTAGAQAIAMAFTPIVTRLYGPEAFGLLGTFIAILTIVTPMAALTYPIAIVLPKADEDAKGLAKLSMVLATVISMLSLIPILFWGGGIAEKLGAVAIENFLWLIPIAMLLTAMHQVMEQVLIRHKQFKVTARVSVVQSVIINSAKVGIGIWYPIAAVLILIQAITSGVHALLLWLGMRETKYQVSFGRQQKSLTELANDYRDFPIYRAPEVTINAISQSLPVLMLAALFGPASAGFYSLGRTVLGVPSTLIGKSVGDVFYPRISEAANKGEKLYPLVRKATLLMAAVGSLPFGAIFVLGPWIFSLVFGSDWDIAGEYARWLAIWMFFLFINSPSVKVIAIVKAQGFQLFYTIFTLAIRVLALFITYYLSKSDVLSIVVFSLVGSVANIIFILFILRKCKKFDLVNY